MTALGNINAGGRILAADVRSVAPYAVIKGADETVTSSTTLQNDDALVKAVPASVSYLFHCYVDYEGGTQGSSDIKWSWSVPSGTTMGYQVVCVSTSGTATVARFSASSTGAAGTNGAATIRALDIHGWITTSTTAGNVQLQWAQNTSSGTGTIVHAGSFLALWRIS